MENSLIDEIRQRLSVTRRELETEMEHQLESQRRQFRYHLQRGKVRFERDVRDWQRRHRIGLWRYVTRANIGYVLTAPVIYAMIVPTVILDLSVTIYQQICFRVYGIPLVKRSDHIVIDRQHLAYLNGIEKINCVYCGYANGTYAYARAIAARTEQFWCPIKHARRVAEPHEYMDDFFDYGDAETYRHGQDALRHAVQDQSEDRS